MADDQTEAELARTRTLKDLILKLKSERGEAQSRIEALEAENKAMLEHVEVMEKALTKIANACTPRMSRSTGEARCGVIAAEALQGKAKP